MAHIDVRPMMALPRIEFMDTALVPCELRNNSEQQLVVTHLRGFLRSEGMRPLFSEGIFDAIFDRNGNVIDPGGAIFPTLRIRAMPGLPLWTVQYDLEIAYQVLDTHQAPQEQVRIVYERAGSVLVCERAPTDNDVFISFRDEEYALADHARELLRNVGISGYIARDDHQLGEHIWERKIPRAICRAKALLVLWTKDAAFDADNIEREIAIAKKCGRPIMLARDISAGRLPIGFDPDEEYEPVEITYAGPTSVAGPVLGPFVEHVYRRIMA